MYDGAAVEAALAASLAALRTDRIDLYQIHWPLNVGIVGDEAACRTAGSWDNVVSAVGALEKAKKDGRIRHWGVCNFGTLDMAALRAAGGAAAVTNQLPYSPVWRAVETGAQASCINEGLAILCYSPLQQGLLSGNISEPKDLADGRRRTRLFGPSASDKSRHGSVGVEGLLFGGGGVLERLCMLSDEQGISMADLAIGWLLAREGVASVLVGASTPQQAKRNAACLSRKPLPAELLRKVDEATDALKSELFVTQRCPIDQYARKSRIHDMPNA